MPFHRAVCLIAFAVTCAACSGDDGGPVTVIDAPLPIDASIDAPIDAAVCGQTMCGAECVNTQTDEFHCGGCPTVCDDGEACLGGMCECPPAFVPANPSFLLNQVRTDIPNTLIGIGGYITTEIDVLVVAKPDAAALDTPFQLSGSALGTPPFVAAGYDVDMQTMLPTAAYYATAGTVTFTRACAGGFAGTAANLTFSAVSGLTAPMLVPNGCTFTVPSVSFAFGAVCP